MAGIGRKIVIALDPINRQNGQNSLHILAIIVKCWTHKRFEPRRMLVSRLHLKSCTVSFRCEKRIMYIPIFVETAVKQ